MYAVKVNTIVKDVVIHKYPCSQIRKRGGIGKYNQVLWRDFDTYSQARDYAEKWKAKGYNLKHCSFCCGKFEI